MRILALDTTGAVCGVAVGEYDGTERRLLCELNVNYRQTHSEALMPAVDSALDFAHTCPSELDAIAVTVGPGSYTGVRIGVCAAKGLAQALDKPLIEIDALEALAENAAPFGGVICPIMDARNGFVYAALFQQGERLMEDEAIELTALIERLKSEGCTVMFAGDGTLTLRGTIESLFPEALLVPKEYALGRAASVFTLALKKLDSGLVTDYRGAAPIYLRQAQYARVR